MGRARESILHRRRRARELRAKLCRRRRRRGFLANLRRRRPARGFLVPPCDLSTNALAKLGRLAVSVIATRVFLPRLAVSVSVPRLAAAVPAILRENGRSRFKHHTVEHPIWVVVLPISGVIQRCLGVYHRQDGVFERGPIHEPEQQLTTVRVRRAALLQLPERGVAHSGRARALEPKIDGGRAALSERSCKLMLRKFFGAPHGEPEVQVVHLVRLL
mmetsp:Transcript_10539/g.16879  ORF Transcript_10539/g.16879 Transcript_10539/m.16879 type:complete len:217 (+) Transcript_10539:217-867(+)